MTALSRSPLALLRHGEALLANEDAARTLTEHGRSQAAAAGAWLEPLGIGRLVTSGSLRARETAAALAGGIEPETDDGLAGLRIGGDETPLRGAAALSAPFAAPARRPPGGESVIDLQDRALAALTRIAARPLASAVVAHRFVNTVLVASLLGVELSAAEALLQDPGGVDLFAAGAGAVLAVNATPDDPLRTGAAARLLPDTESPVERRRYLLAVGGPGDGARQAEIAAAIRELDGALPAELKIAASAEVAAGCAEAAGLGTATARRLPAAPGSVAILDHGAGRWWLRCCGWDPGLPRRLAAG